MNKKILFIIILIAVIIIAVGIFYWRYQLTPEELKDDNTFTFVCPSGNEIKISYHEKSDSASLFVEGEKYELNRVVSASGARYANDDETVVFWEHQGKASVEVDGETIYKECELKE